MQKPHTVLAEAVHDLATPINVAFLLVEQMLEDSNLGILEIPREEIQDLQEVLKDADEVIKKLRR